MAIEICQLFSHSRVSDSKTAVLLALYFPLGLLIACLRLFIGLNVFILSCFLPKHSLVRRFLLRTVYLVLGFVIYPSSLENVDPATKVIVANHISVLDHVIIRLIFPSVVPNVWSLPPFLSWALGYANMEAPQGRQVFLEAVRGHCQRDARPVLAFPEGAMTNGTVGLLKFSSWAFSVGQDVQPVILTTHRPVINIQTEALGSSLWQDLLWFLFVPCTIFRVRVLPVERRADFETADEFSGAVQGVMALAMGLECTPFTSADKAEYLKRTSGPPTSPGPQISARPSHTKTTTTAITVPRTQSNPLLDRMVKQVQEVLPHIPQHIIRTDLESTNSVDDTICNVLENNTSIPIPPEATPGSSKAAEVGQHSPKTPSHGEDTPDGAFSTPSPSCTKFAADHFGRSSADRQRSLEERKAALLANARRRFTEISDSGN